jgi:hypothetical protein
MLQPDVYWVREVEGVRLAIMPRPRSGEWLIDEISGYQRMGVQTVVSLLESHEARELELADEESLCRAANLLFLSFPIVDRGVPSNSVEFTKLVESIVRCLRSGDSGCHSLSRWHRAVRSAGSLRTWDVGSCPRFCICDAWPCPWSDGSRYRRPSCLGASLSTEQLCTHEFVSD